MNQIIEGNVAHVAGVRGEGRGENVREKGRDACYENRAFRITPTNFYVIQFHQLSITVNRLTNQKLARASPHDSHH